MSPFIVHGTKIGGLTIIAHTPKLRGMEPKPRVLPAIIADTQERLNQLLDKVSFAPEVMLDLMDGRFVPSQSLLFPMRLRDDQSYQLHIMAEDPLRWVQGLPGEVESVAFHLEAVGDPELVSRELERLGFQVFLALNPATPFEEAKGLLDGVDGLLVMTVEPGGYGAPFTPDALVKVSEARRLHPSMDLEVDGGMKPETARMAREAGANVFASGSYIVKSQDPLEAYRRLLEAVG